MKNDKDEIFEMTVDLNVLDHLGINLYSNIAAVLTEAVANSWDSDASRVDIRVDPENEWVEITDDGCGMSVNDMNEKYLRVGYRRRQEDHVHGKVTAKGRKVMGRKGLGKLSLFSIAQEIEVQSAKDDDTSGFKMTVAGIHTAVEKQAAYHPEPLPPEKLTVTKGTMIILRKLKRQRLGVGIAALRKRLSRRFSIMGQKHGFIVSIDGDEITAKDRGDLPKAQFVWTFKDDQIDKTSIDHVLEHSELDSRLDTWCEDWKVKGWLGTARFPKDLDSEEAGNLNGIVVFARGRLIHENVLDQLNDGRLYTKYITGQIEADFLDMDDEPDIATSDRQRIQEDDPRYTQLMAFLRSALNEMEKQWSEWRRKHEVKKAKEQSPALAEWIDGLGPGFKESAENLISRLSSLPLDKEEDRAFLYRHGVFAFERMKLRGSTEAFAKAPLDVEQLFKLLADRDMLESSIYRDIVKSRLEVIRAFRKIVDEDAKEAVLQQYLFDHLWLLDPAWERATSSEVMESRLLDSGIIVEDLTEKERLGRVDIKYSTIAGTHLIIELKRVSRKMKLIELQEQGQLYVDKLKKILLEMDEPTPNIEVVFVIGKPLDEEANNPERLKSSMAAVSPGSRIIHYDTLIHAAQSAYAEYLDQSAHLDKLEKIVGSL